MPSMTAFERKRLDKIEFSTKIEVIELLRLIIDDIEKGEIAPDGLMAIAITRDPDGPSKIKLSHYRAGLPRDQEIALLTAALHKQVAAWVD